MSAGNTTDCFLVGIDNSECSLRALDFARDRAKRLGGKLVVCYVIEWSPYSFASAEENAQRRKRRIDEQSAARRGVLDPALERLADAGIEATGEIRHGDVAGVLNDLAKEHGASQMVVGRIGESGLASLLFGSVTSKLVQMATVPVTVVP